MDVYWDTSCVLKLYCSEMDSRKYLRRVERAAAPLVSSILAASELVYAFHQKEARREIGTGSAEALYEKFLSDLKIGRFLLLPLGEDVRGEARQIARICYDSQPAVPLRTLDGLHLATACLAGCREILTTDLRMQNAAPLLGIAVG